VTPYDFDWHNNFARLAVVQVEAPLEWMDLSQIVVVSSSVSVVPQADPNPNPSSLHNNNNNQTELSSFFMLDVLVFYLPAASKTDDWPHTAGVGAHTVKQYQDHVVYCCTPKAVRAGLCHTPDRVLLNRPLFRGVQIQVELIIPAFQQEHDTASSLEVPLGIVIDIVPQPSAQTNASSSSSPVVVLLDSNGGVPNGTTTTTTPQRLRLEVEPQEEGRGGTFVVAVANCNPNGRTVQVQGSIEWQPLSSSSANGHDTILVVMVVATAATALTCVMLLVVWRRVGRRRGDSILYSATVVVNDDDDADADDTIRQQQQQQPHHKQKDDHQEDRPPVALATLT
jgi:hypothetical protein